MRNKEILPFVIKWMDLKGIMLDETGQKKKDRHYMILLTYGIKKKQKTPQKQRTEWWLSEAGSD